MALKLPNDSFTILGFATCRGGAAQDENVQRDARALGVGETIDIIEAELEVAAVYLR